MNFRCLFVGRYAFVALALISSVLSASADRVNVGDLWYEIDHSSKTAKVVSRQENAQILEQIETAYESENVIVPSLIEVDGVSYKVTSIGKVAFSKSSVRTISLPPTILVIDPGAFRKAAELTEIIIPTGAAVETGAFGEASSLIKVVLPEDIRDIQNATFEHTALKTVSLPSTVVSIGTSSFFNVPLDGGIFLNEGLKTIGKKAFAGENQISPTKLTEIVIPSTVNTIEGHAFYDSSISTLWFAGCPEHMYSPRPTTPFSGMMVESIVWGGDKKGNNEIVVGAKEGVKPTVYYNKVGELAGVWPSIKYSTYSQPDGTASASSLTRVVSEILGYLPPVSFGAGKIDLKDYTGLCTLTDLTYESSDPTIASVEGSVVTFKKAGIVTIKTTSASDSDDRPLVGKERRLCIMPVTVAVEIGADDKLTYRSGSLTEEQIKGLLTAEAKIARVRVKDEEGNDWAMRYATGAEGDGLVFVYGTTAPVRALPEISLPVINTEIRYGDEAFDLSVVDGAVAGELELTYRSSDETILRVDGTKLVPVGVGTVSVTAVADGAEFVDDGVRTVVVGPREAIVTAKSVTIEDDAAVIPAVGFTVDGLVGDDRVGDIVTSWRWNVSQPEAGVYDCLAPELADNPLYEVTVSDEPAQLYIVRAVTRPVADLTFGDGGRSNEMVVTLSGSCRLSCGYGAVSGQTGSMTLSIGEAATAGSCRVLCDYPEHITGIIVKEAGVNGIVFHDGVLNLASADLSGNSLVPGSLVVPDAIAGALELTAGSQSPIKIVVKNDNEVDLGGHAVGAVVKWLGRGGRVLAEGTDYSRADDVYTFLKTLEGVYAEIFDGLIAVNTAAVNVRSLGGNAGDSEENGGGLTGAIGDVAGESKDRAVDVYTLGGVLVKRGASLSEATDGLAAGMYIVDGKVYKVK